MKSKYIVLLAICSVFCALGCACKDDEPQDSSSSSSETVFTETDAILSVNHEEVTIGVGETFTLIAEAENMSNPIFTWAVDGDAAGDVVSITPNGNTAVLTAVKTGTTKLVVSVATNGYTYFQTVQVTVVESDNVTLELHNIGFDNDGYHARLCTLDTAQGEKRSVDASYTVYKDNKNVAVSNFTWTVQDAGVVSVTDNKFTALKEGKTNVVGTYTVDGKQYTVNVSVEVYRPTIALQDSFVVEVENLSEYTIQSEILGIPRGVVYNGQTVGSFDGQSKKITLSRDKMPTKAVDLGENRQMTVETDLASYAVNVNMYTKIIRDKADFDGMSALAKKADPDLSSWDGYFVLGANIAYNGQFDSKIADMGSFYLPGAAGDNWFNGGLYGFKGVFDGKGYTIEGISIDNGDRMASVFGVLHISGVVKNVAFTHASVAANSSLVCHAGGGSVENVYVQYDSIGKGTQHYEGDGSINSHCGTFFSFKEPTATASVSNCVVDISKAEINKNISIKAIGSEYASIKNVFLIGGSAEIQKKSNATLSFSSVMDFVENANAQSRYKKFDETFWSMAGGVPVSNCVYEGIKGNNVQFTDKPSYMVAGTAYKFSLNNDYVLITANHENVTISGGVATIADGVENNQEIVFTATSLFNSAKKDTFTCTVSAIDFSKDMVDLTAEKTTAFYDLTEKKLYFAELGDKITSDVLYFVNPDYTAATYADDGDKTTVLAVAKDKLFKVNCTSVTKVISTAEDVHYIRRDYTVSSYGNPGCYDGVITGNFVMINDIDCKDLALKNSGTYWENSRGFGGTFDGRGYTIKNLSVGINGLFGTLSYATIKNVNFTNVRLKANGESGAYVALFANSVYNTVIDNVSMQFGEYVSKDDSLWNNSGLMFFEKTFDSTLKNLTIDISSVSGVKYLTAILDNAELPNKSEKKSTYENVKVIYAKGTEKPVFAYKDVPIDPNDATKGTKKEAVAYPDSGFTFEEV